MITTVNSMPVAIRQSLEEMALYAPYETVPALLFANESNLPMHSGLTKTFTRFNQLSAVPMLIPTDGLGEPAPEPLGREFISADLNYYGKTLVLNSQLINHDQYDIVQQAVQRVGEARLRTENALVMDMLYSGTAEYICDNGNNGDSPTQISDQDLTAVSTSHRVSNVSAFTESIPARTGEGTFPVPESFILIAHPSIRPSLFADSRFLHASQYGSNYRVSEMDIGELGEHRIFTTTSARINTRGSQGGRNVASCVSFGRDCYARIRSDGANTDVTIHDPQHTSYHGMNLAITSTFAQAQCILQDFGIMRVECTV